MKKPAHDCNDMARRRFWHWVNQHYRDWNPPRETCESGLRRIWPELPERDLPMKLLELLDEAPLNITDYDDEWSFAIRDLEHCLRGFNQAEKERKNR